MSCFHSAWHRGRYQEVRRGSERRRTARRFVDEHLDPVLKAADELVGKLRSLAMADFKMVTM